MGLRQSPPKTGTSPSPSKSESCRALLFIAASIGVGIEAFLSFRRVRDPALHTLSLAVLGGSLGFLVLGSMLSVVGSPGPLHGVLVTGGGFGRRQGHRCRSRISEVTVRIAVCHNQPTGGARRALHGFCRQLGMHHSLDLFTLDTSDDEWLHDADVAQRVHRAELRRRQPIPLGLYLNEVIAGLNRRELDAAYAAMARTVDSGRLRRGPGRRLPLLARSVRSRPPSHPVRILRAQRPGVAGGRRVGAAPYRLGAGA